MPIVRFQLFGFPVQILPGYWLLTAVLSFLLGRPTLAAGLTTMFVMFVSILAHELGHGFAARAFGLHSNITLHAQGGATTFPGAAELTRGRDIAISLAGPLAGFALALVGWRVLAAVGGQPAEPSQTPLAAALQTLVLINVMWSITNLIPVIPFDGGRIMAAALGPTRRMLAASLSLVIGVGAGVGFGYLGQPLAAIVFATSAISSFFHAQQERKAPKPVVLPSVTAALTEARAALAAGRFDQTEALCHAVLRTPSSNGERKAAFELLLWSRLGRGDAKGARVLLLPSSNEGLDPYLVAAIHDAAGYPEDAQRVLVQAQGAGDQRLELTALLVRVLLTLGKGAAAANLTRTIVRDIPAEEVQRVITEARKLGATEEAERLQLELTPASG
jgi:Zn-dependent protease